MKSRQRQTFRTVLLQDIGTRRDSIKTSSSAHPHSNSEATKFKYPRLSLDCVVHLVIQFTVLLLSMGYQPTIYKLTFLKMAMA
jgi:hypothetical protein